MSAAGFGSHGQRQAASLEPAQARAVFARLNAMAARFFCDRLANSWVPGYLKARGFSPDTAQRWHVGYAPAAWDTLTRHLRARGCPEALIEAAGLARRSSRGTLIDTFRDRVMFPIRSPNGIVTGFISRAAPDVGPQVPKYLNTPRTCLYDKSAALFGLWEGRRALAQGAQPVIVEGPLDAIAVTTAGHGSHIGVAPCGTALTHRHAEILSRHAHLTVTGAVAGFDSDDAGRQACVRAYHLLSPMTEELTALTFLAGRDPAQVLAERGAACLARMLSTSTRPLADLVVDEDIRRWARWLDHAEGQINAMRSAARLIAAMPPGQVARQVARLADRLGLDTALVTGVVADAVPGVLPTQGRGHGPHGPARTPPR